MLALEGGKEDVMDSPVCVMQHSHKYLHLSINFFFFFQATDNDVGTYGKVSYFFSDDPDR